MRSSHGTRSQTTSDESRRRQRRLKRVTALDEDRFNEPVELEDVVDGARRPKTSPDKDWA